ncbi:MAG TPA: hypothetical protein VN618_04015 [Solirubrobacteraceae bacterium]|nr:hypothetical protein [Solirubrobacteraceae bacterium]
MATTLSDTEPRRLPEGVAVLPAPRMPPAPLLVRLKTSTLLRRFVPNRLAVARAERKGARLFDTDESTRRQALSRMEAVVAGTPRAAELEQLARRSAIEREAWNAVFWQPWPRPRLAPGTPETVLAARAAGRGVIFSLCHLGPYFANARALWSIGVECCVVSGDWFFEQPSHDLWGRRLARWRRGLPPVPLVRPRGSYAALAELLSQGACVMNYFDLPGRRETRFLGKPAWLVDGTARLAVDTGALVVPLRPHRDGARMVLEAFEPVDPRDFADAAELHGALAALHERLILERAAEIEDPVEIGWGDGATPTGWRAGGPS